MKPFFGGFGRCTAPLAHTNGEWFFAMHRTVGACRWRMVLGDAPHVGAYQRGMVLSMGDVDGWQEVFMQNYSCVDCFEIMAFRYFFYDLSFN